VDGAAGPEATRGFQGSLLELSVEVARDDRSGAYFVGATMPDRGAGPFFDAYFQGEIGDVRIYDRALTASDIQVIRQESGVR
jgi:hypothetical protein